VAKVLRWRPTPRRCSSAGSVSACPGGSTSRNAETPSWPRCGGWSSATVAGCHDAGYRPGGRRVDRVITDYFKNKDEVLRAALDLSHLRIAARREQRLEGLAGRAALEALLCQMLPLDAERRLEMHIEVTTWARAVSDDTSRERHLVSHDRSLELLEQLVEGAEAAGDFSTGLDARRVAEALLTFVDGLGVDALCTPIGCRRT
jgi:hypothetical protein